MGREGARLHRRRRERRGPLADREVPLGARARRVPGRARLDGALRRRRARPRSRACSAACALHLGRELDLIDDGAQTSSTGCSTSRSSSGRGHGQLDVPAPSVHGADARAGGRGTSRTRPGVQGQHYDLIWNGWELGSGSIRIHDVELQQKVFRTMGLSDEEAAVEVRLPARGARDGRAAARRLRDGDRAVRRAAWRASPTSAR